jgi:hypothetical protein
MPLDGVVDKGMESRGIGHHHVKLQFPPGAPAANV